MSHEGGRSKDTFFSFSLGRHMFDKDFFFSNCSWSTLVVGETDEWRWATRVAVFTKLSSLFLFFHFLFYWLPKVEFTMVSGQFWAIRGWKIWSHCTHIIIFERWLTGDFWNSDYEPCEWQISGKLSFALLSSGVKMNEELFILSFPNTVYSLFSEYRLTVDCRSNINDAEPRG